jgi:hypothetical protein
MITTARAEIAEALSTVDGVTGHAYRPPAPSTGDAYPLVDSLTRAAGASFAVAWRVILILPADERAASDWLDAHVLDVADALSAVGYVTTASPVVIAIAGTDTYALEINMTGD